MVEGTQLEFERSLFMPNMTVRAMRDSRYKHPANALAELIDNSIDAGARRIEVLVSEQQQVITTRRSWRVGEIAVVDDGSGMDARTLEQALRFGGRGGQGQLNRIGRYGMGLPTASVSQARRVDVWTWQRRGDVLHSYIDLEKVEKGEQTEVPPAERSELPDEWREFVTPDLATTQSGTLVVWRNIDRIKGQADTLFRQLESEVGRIYRHFINDGELTIRMARRRGAFTPEDDALVRPNDPLYLMSNSSTPAPWGESPMFQPVGNVIRYPVRIDGREETVEVRYSIVTQEALGLQAQNPGAMLHGQHARSNMGVSVVRENREIVLEDAFVRTGGRGDTPQNRWWGCEIRFNQGCDDLFGVDHNKQMVSILSNAAREVLNSDDSTDKILEDLDVDEDWETKATYQIVGDIKNQTRNLLNEVKVMFDKRDRERQRQNAPDSPASHIQTPSEIEAINLMSLATDDAIMKGVEKQTRTDKEREATNPEIRESETQTYLVDELGEAEDEAMQEAKDIVESGIQFIFKHVQLDAYHMFNVRNRGGVLYINLNITHPFYQFLKDLTDDEGGLESEDPQVRRAAVGIRTLLLAWSRMEDHIELPEETQQVQDYAGRWGRHAQYVLERVNQT